MLEDKLVAVMMPWVGGIARVPLQQAGTFLAGMSLLGLAAFSTMSTVPQIGPVRFSPSSPVTSETAAAIPAQSPATPAAIVVPVPVPATPPLERRQLIERLQRALIEKKCLAGSVDGAWTSATRRALQDYLLAVNAVLPVEKPAEDHLALLNGNPGARCGGGPVGTKAATATSAAAVTRQAALPAAQEDGAHSATPNSQGSMEPPATAGNSTASTGPNYGDESAPVPSVGVYERPAREPAHKTKSPSRKSGTSASKSVNAFFKSIEKALSNGF